MTSNYDIALKAEMKRVVRHWQSYSTESRTIMASASLKYRSPAGKYFYVHPTLPKVAFQKRKLAAEAAMTLQSLSSLKEALQEAIQVFEGMCDDEIEVELLPRLRSALPPADLGAVEK